MNNMSRDMQMVTGKIVVMRDMGKSWDEIAYVLSISKKLTLRLYSEYRRFVYGEV